MAKKCWIVRDVDQVSDISTVYLNEDKAKEGFKSSVKYYMDYLETDVDDNDSDVDDCLERGRADFGNDGFVTIEDSTLIED